MLNPDVVVLLLERHCDLPDGLVAQNSGQGIVVRDKRSGSNGKDVAKLFPIGDRRWIVSFGPFWGRNSEETYFSDAVPILSKYAHSHVQLVQHPENTN